jgi:hypothetical protein
MRRKSHVRFGGGPTEKARAQRDLAGGLPNGAFIYMSAGGSPRQMESGKQAMINALFGLAIVILARAVAGAVGQALGAGSG